MSVVPGPRKKVVFLSAVTSDIGIALAKRYARDGYIITGTYRSKKLLPELENLPECHLFYCDLAERQSIDESIAQFAELDLSWDTFISCASWPPPLRGFFEGDFDEWTFSVHINAIEQFRILHAMYPMRDPEVTANVVLFGGPGTNNAVTNFSALTLSKTMLLKSCELLHAENEDINAFIVGPGWTRTKTHDAILSDPYVSDEKRHDTLDFLNSNSGTSMDDIYDCIRWLCDVGRSVAGGRNFSVVHDPWGSNALVQELSNDFDMYKLRRYRNDWRALKN